jgi:hypothetical protein
MSTFGLIMPSTMPLAVTPVLASKNGTTAAEKASLGEAEVGAGGGTFFSNQYSGYSCGI